MQKVTVIDGRELEVDTSRAACQVFGFEPNQRVIDVHHDTEGTVIGTAPLPEGTGCMDAGDNALWVAMDNNEGKVCLLPHPEENLQAI